MYLTIASVHFVAYIRALCAIFQPTCYGQNAIMKKHFTIFIVFICFTACGQSRKSVDLDKEKLNTVCDKFMKEFQEGNTSDALQLLKGNSVMAVSTIDTLELTIRNQLDQILPAYGKMISSEFILERNIKDF